MSMMRKLMRSALRADTPVLFIGPPGVGKTAVAEEVAEEDHAVLVPLIGSQLDPTDVGGVLVPDMARNRGTRLPDDWVITLREALDAGKPAYLFLDELTCAPLSVQAALLRVVQNRSAAGIDLSGVRIIAAANPVAMAADGWDLRAATANRWVHLKWVTDRAEWAQGMRDGWGKPQSPELAAARALVAQYVMSVSQAANGTDDVPPLLVIPKDPEAQGQAWPSPRTWDITAKLLATESTAALLKHVEAKKSAMSDVAHTLVSGAVGTGQAISMLTWLTEQALPDPEELLAKPLEAKLPERLDRLSTAIETTCATACGEHKERRKRVLAAWDLLTRIPKDIAVPAAGTLCRARNRIKGLQLDKLPALGVELDKLLRSVTSA